MRAPPQRSAPALIHHLRAPRHALDEPVQHHVAGTHVEGHHRLGPLPRREDRQVRNPPDVQHRARLRGVMEQPMVEVRGQRRPLPPRRDVPGPEVGHRGDARALRDDRGLAYLKGSAHPMIPLENRLREVEDGLTMAGPPDRYPPCPPRPRKGRPVRSAPRGDNRAAPPPPGVTHAETTPRGCAFAAPADRGLSQTR